MTQPMTGSMPEMVTNTSDAVVSTAPLVPGVGLYRAMSALATGDMAAGASIAAHTMALIVMIALGIGLGTALVGADRGAKH